MTEDRHSRRLHPRLRMVRNGSSDVNAVRSEISTTVISTKAAQAERTGDLEDRGGLGIRGVVEAQESIQQLDVSALSFAEGSLPKRKKLNETDPADDAFVNVFIDVSPERASADTGVDLDHEHDEHCVRAVCERVREALPNEALPALSSIVRRHNMVSAAVPVSSLANLEDDPNVAFVSIAEPLKLDVPVGTSQTQAPGSRRVSRKKLHANGANVIIGIIDVGGFDFTHEEFMNAGGDGTRFLSIWDQGGRLRNPPERFGYGSEIRREQLDAALRESSQSGAFPATVLEPQSQQRPGSHGTHVASIAAGRHGVCPDADIAAVLVDIPMPEDARERRRFTFSDTSRITHAVEYLLDVAKRENKPISINISLGTNGGAHDGSSGVSRWLDHALMTPGRAVCLAAGNAGQERATSEEDIGWINGRIHTSGHIPSRGLEVEIEWTVIGNGIADISENELEIWYSPQDRFIASVKPPGEDKWYEVKPQEYRENQRLKSGTTISIYNELYHKNNGANYIAIYLSPNLDPEDVRGVEAGVWKVRLRGEEIRDGRFHAWIERDDPIEIGRSERARFFRFPSFFSAASNVDSHSISSLACGHNVVAVANLDPKSERVNITSSQGPARDGRQKPDIAAPGTGIVAANGFRPLGSEKKRWISLSGTSMASPYVAGVVGLMLSANSALTSAQCAGILQRTAQPLPGMSFEWQNDAGFGGIDASAAVAEAATFALRKERR